MVYDGTNSADVLAFIENAEGGPYYYVSETDGRLEIGGMSGGPSPLAGDAVVVPNGNGRPFSIPAAEYVAYWSEVTPIEGQAPDADPEV